MTWAFLLLAAVSTQVVDTQLRPAVEVSGALGQGEAHRFTIAANAADFVRVNLKVTGVKATIEIRDPAALLLARRTVAASGSTPDEREIGFLAHVSGQYVVHFKASVGSSNGSYTILMTRRPDDERMKGLAIPQPKSDAASPRIGRLQGDISAGVKGAEEAFWREASRSGTPFVEGSTGRGDVLVTFVWRETFSTWNVLLWWGGHDDSYYMNRVAGTSVWHTTLRVRDDSRFGYAISPNDRGEDRGWTMELDPLNRKRFPDTEGLRAPATLSVFEMPRAPDMRWALAPAPRKGTLQDIRLESTTFTEAPILATIYTPSGYRSGAASYPLLILFNAWEYTNSIRAPAILDNLIAAGRIRPVVVCFIDAPFRGAFRVDSPFLNGIATDAVPQLRSRYAISTSATDLVIGGFSGGATAAAFVAFKYPTVFGNLLAQSAGLNQADASGRPNAIARLYEDAERRPIRLYLDVGLYEPNTERNREWKAVLTAKGYDLVYRERGATHHPLHAAGTLPEALMSLLAPRR